MKIYITGVAGFLGSHLADSMLADGHEVVGCDTLIGGYLDNVNKGVRFEEFDCLDLERLSKSVKGCDVVYHTACLAYEGLSVFSPSIVCQNTMQISVNAMVAAIRAGSKRFVLCSSMARYGYQPITPFTEDMVCKPLDPYGISKFASEEILRVLAKTHGIELVIAVPHNIVGIRQKYDDPFRNVASIMINLMLQGRQPVIYGDGSQVRCFSDVDDDILLLNRMSTFNVADQVINIGPDKGEISILELANKISKIIDFDLNPIFVEDRPLEVKHATCSANKARKLLNHDSNTPLEVTLEKMVNWISSRGTCNFDYHLPVEIMNKLTPKTWSQKLF